MGTKLDAILSAFASMFAVSCITSAQVVTVTSAPTRDWFSIASSADGVRVVAVTQDGSIYTSPDSGETWISNNVPSEQWSAVACSADGQKLDVASWSGLIYTSLDSGATWKSNHAPVARWAAVASSADGTQLVAASPDGPVFRSRDAGATWAQLSAPSNSWQSIVCSADGMWLMAAGWDKNQNFCALYVSTNSGSTWTAADLPPHSHLSLACSADGRVALAATYDGTGDMITGGPVYSSTDFGTTWTQSSAPSNVWNSALSSADGTKLFVIGREQDHQMIYLSADAGTNWAQITPLPIGSVRLSATCSANGDLLLVPAPEGEILSVAPAGRYLGPWERSTAPAVAWSLVTSSADGTKVAAAGSGLIFTSADSGATWALTTAPTNNWTSIVLSANGGRLVSTSVTEEGGRIYVSEDLGTTWRDITFSNMPSKTAWVVATSADGMKLVAAATTGSIYTSADFGVTWVQTSAPSNLWSAVVSSADGTHLVALSPLSGGSVGTQVYTSTNSGVVWTLTNSIIYPDNLHLACSEDTTKLFAASDGGIYTSVDFGANWIESAFFGGSTVHFWSSVASSADGRTLVAMEQGAVYVSSDSGTNWASTLAPSCWSWGTVGCSADAKKLVSAVSYSGGGGGAIYTLKLPLQPSAMRRPELVLGPARGATHLSWLIPSSSFVLQANSDLSDTTWTDITNAPTLNFTNLHYEVNLQPFPGNRFYRLKQE